MHSPRITGRARSLGGGGPAHACKPECPRVRARVWAGLAYRHHPPVHSPKVRGKGPMSRGEEGGPSYDSPTPAWTARGSAGMARSLGGSCPRPRPRVQTRGSAEEGRVSGALCPQPPAHACAARRGVGLRRGRGRPRGPAGMRGREGGARPRTGRYGIQWAPGTVGCGQSGRGGGAASLWAGPGHIPGRLKRGRVRGALRDGGWDSRLGE